MEFDYGIDKDKILKQTRGIGFEDIIAATKNGDTLLDIEHTNQDKYPKQRLLVVKIDNKAFVAPYILIEDNKGFFRTLYPSTKYTKQYLIKPERLQDMPKVDPLKHIVLDKYEQEIEDSIDENAPPEPISLERKKELAEAAARFIARHPERFKDYDFKIRFQAAQTLNDSPNNS